MPFPRVFVEKATVVKSGRKRHRESDSWSSFRKLPSLQWIPHTKDKDQIPILCVGRLRWISHISFRAYWFECSLPLSPWLFLLSRSRSLSPSFLRSFSCNKFVGRRTQNKNPCYAVTVRILCSWDLARICIRANYLSLVRDLPSSNMLEAAISVSLLRSPIHHFGRPCWRRHGSGRVWLGEWNIFLRPQAFTPFRGGLG